MSDSGSVLEAIGRFGVVPVVASVDVARAQTLGTALKEGGLPCAEVTFRTASAEASLRIMASDPDVLVGAGTVLTCKQADQALAAGARFIVSPGLSPELVRYCLDIDVTVIPGIATASEVQAALELGVEVVKFFPAEPLGGIAMLAALAAPFPGLRFIPTGGVGLAQMPIYLIHQYVHAVGASWIVDPIIVAAGHWGEVSRRAAAACAAVEAARADFEAVKNGPPPTVPAVGNVR